MYEKTRRLTSLLTALVDLAASLCALALALLVRAGGLELFRPEYARPALLVAVLWPVCLWLFGCYGKALEGPSSRLFLRTLGACAAGTAALGLVAFFARWHFMSRGVLAAFVPFGLVAVVVARGLLWSALGTSLRRRVLVVGNATDADRFVRRLPGRLAPHVVGWVGLTPGQGRKVERSLAELAPVDEVVIAVPVTRLCEVGEALRVCEERGAVVRIPLEFPGGPERKLELDRFADGAAVLLRSSPVDPLALALKRALDVTGALVGLALTAVVFPFVALSVRLTSSGPVIFRQTRVGLNGRRFTLYKFRTMVENAEAMKAELSSRNEMVGPVFKIEDDPRVTAVGRFLRRTSIDELPQFWNVLRGDMSLVGTRPPTPDEVSRYGNGHFRRLTMKPGITGNWQTNGRSSVRRFEDIVRLDLQYISNWSLWLDAKLILSTVPAILLRRNAS